MASSTSTANGSDVVVGGTTYVYQNSGAADAAAELANGALQFTVNGGDYWNLDPTSVNRSEITSTQQISNGTAVETSYVVSVQTPIDTNPNDWTILGQFHQNDAPNLPHNPPPFAVKLVGGKMTIVIGYTNFAGKDVTQTVWADAARIQQGANYAMDVKATFDSNGNGHLVVSRNGVVIVSYAGPLGYASQSGVYWKEGIYRSATTATTTADFSNLAVKTGSGGATVTSGSSTSTSGTSNVFSTTTDYDPTTGALSGRTVIYTDGSQVADLYSGGRTTQHTETKASGIVTLLERFNADGSLAYLQQLGTDGSQTYNTYNSTGVIQSSQVIRADGSQTVNAYNGSGVLQTSKVVNVDGSKDYYDYSNSAFKSIVTHVNAQGVTTQVVQTATDGSRRVAVYGGASQDFVSDVKLYTAGGVETSSAWSYKDGSKEADGYAGNGVLTSSVVTGTDGVQTTKTFTSSGVMQRLQIVRPDGSRDTTYYDATGTKTSTVSVHTDGWSETDSFASNGVMTQSIAVATDGTQTTQTYGSTGTLQQTKIVGANGWREYINYDSAGAKTSTATYHTDGSSETDVFATNGAETQAIIAATDGSQTTYSYSSTGSLQQTKIVKADGSREYITYNSSGAKTMVSSYNADGSSETDSYAGNGALTQSILSTKDGTQTTNTYDSSGVLQQTKIIHPDGSRDYATYDSPGYKSILTHINPQGVTTEVRQTFTDGSRRVADYGITGQSYTSQVVKYDVSGNNISTARYHTDGTLDYSNTLNGDGSRTINTYDASGRMTTSSSVAANGAITEKALAPGISILSGTGNDVFTSYNGDTFVFHGSTGHDTIYNFNSGSGSLHDVLQLDKAAVADFSHVAMAQNGSDTIVSISSANTIDLKGVRANSLVAADFKFV